MIYTLFMLAFLLGWVALDNHPDKPEELYNKIKTHYQNKSINQEKHNGCIKMNGQMVPFYVYRDLTGCTKTVVSMSNHIVSMGPDKVAEKQELAARLTVITEYVDSLIDSWGLRKLW